MYRYVEPVQYDLKTQANICISRTHQVWFRHVNDYYCCVLEISCGTDLILSQMFR